MAIEVVFTGSRDMGRPADVVARRAAEAAAAKMVNTIAVARNMVPEGTDVISIIADLIEVGRRVSPLAIYRMAKKIK